MGHAGADVPYLFHTGVEVRVKEWHRYYSHKNVGFGGQIGVVRHVCGEREYCSVFLPAEERTVTILSEDLEPVVPEEGDQVMILSGDEIGFTGRLHTLFHYVGEALIQLDSGAITLVQLTNLAKTPAHLHY